MGSLALPLALSHCLHLLTPALTNLTPVQQLWTGVQNSKRGLVSAAATGKEATALNEPQAMKFSQHF